MFGHSCRKHCECWSVITFNLISLCAGEHCPIFYLNDCFVFKKVKSLRPVTFPRVHPHSGSQDQASLLSCQRRSFRVSVQFNHTCHIQYGVHAGCYPTVTACSNTVPLPVQHMQTYSCSSMWWQRPPTVGISSCLGASSSHTSDQWSISNTEN